MPHIRVAYHATVRVIHVERRSFEAPFPTPGAGKGLDIDEQISEDETAEVRQCKTHGTPPRLLIPHDADREC